MFNAWGALVGESWHFLYLYTHGPCCPFALVFFKFPAFSVCDGWMLVWFGGEDEGGYRFTFHKGQYLKNPSGRVTVLILSQTNQPFFSLTSVTSVCSLRPLSALRWFTQSKMMLLENRLAPVPNVLQAWNTQPFRIYDTRYDDCLAEGFASATTLTTTLQGGWVSAAVAARWFGRFLSLEWNFSNYRLRQLEVSVEVLWLHLSFVPSDGHLCCFRESLSVLLLIRLGSRTWLTTFRHR